jgi:hypothetical protein
MSRATLATAAAAALLGFVADASAAMDTRLSISPVRPQAGTRATIFLRPYWTLTTGDVPADLRYPFRLQALGPGGRDRTFRPTKTRDPYVWSAPFVFPVAGRWEIRVVNYYSGVCFQRGCEYRGRRLVVRVTARRG